MPTGYTAPVQDGKITEFSDFALNCARAFGALILLRDSDTSLETTKRFIDNGSYLENSTYNEERIRKATERIAELRRMSDEEVLACAQSEANDVVRRNRERAVQTQTERARYENMLDKVKAWTPPTEDHVSFKNFMIEQLEGSIDFDCTPYQQPVPEVSLKWRDDQIAMEERSLELAVKNIQESRKRDASRKAWIEGLINSLEEYSG